MISPSFARGTPLLTLLLSLTASCGELDDTQVDSPEDPVESGPYGEVCLNVDLSSYSTSCAADSDCVLVLSGEVCSTCLFACADLQPGNQGLSGDYAISASERARYVNATAPVAAAEPFPCSCASNAGVARCFAGKCTYCLNHPAYYDDDAIAPDCPAPPLDAGIHTDGAADADGAPK